MKMTDQHPDQGSNAPVPPDFRALCAELAKLDGHCVVDCTEEWAEAMCRLRTALAQPMPPGPTDEELIKTASDAGLCYPVCWDLPENEMQMKHLRNFARAVLARFGNPTPQPVPPAEALAARPLLEKVARMGDCIGANTVGEIMAISDRAAAWLRENPPGQPVAIEPRGCPTPGACSCVEPVPPRPTAGQKPLNTDMDANRWASEFVSLHGGDHELMRAWFANALMCGWDNHYWTTPEYKALVDSALSGGDFDG